MKCFLLIDFDHNLIGIRSVDSAFSAIVHIRGDDLVRVEDIVNQNYGNSNDQKEH